MAFVWEYLDELVYYDLQHHTHAHTSLGTLSKDYSKSTKPKHSFFPLTLKFSCICLTMKMASVVHLLFINPGCISYISIYCRILHPEILSMTFIARSNNLIPL